MKSFPSETKVGDEFITKNKDDAHGGYVLTIISVKKDKNLLADSIVKFSTVDMHRTKSGNAKFKSSESDARLWWFNEFCTKVKRK